VLTGHAEANRDDAVYRSIFGGWGGQTAARTRGFLAVHARFEQRENRSCGWWRRRLWAAIGRGARDRPIV
jgi:hypothetical protein